MTKSYINTKIATADDLIELVGDWDIVYCNSDRYIENHDIDISFSQRLGYTFLDYSEKNYISFNGIFEQNELHYDGISADGKRVVPDYLLFNIENIHKVPGGEFLILHTKDFLSNLPNKIRSRLENLNIHYYQFKSIFNPNPNKNQFSFTLKAVQNFYESYVLRMHIPLTLYKKDVVIDGEFVHCLVDDIKMHAPGYSGRDLLDLYEELNTYIFASNALYKFNFKNNDILIVNNKLAFHGRLATSSLDSRLMHRIQMIKHDKM